MQSWQLIFIKFKDISFSVMFGCLQIMNQTKNLFPNKEQFTEQNGLRSLECNEIN